LIDNAGFGREVAYALRLPTLPGYSEGAVAWGKTPLGAFQRAWLRVPLLFGRPERVPAEWISEQTRIAQLPGFTEATMATLRAQVDLGGQREILVDQLSYLQMPALLVWREQDRVFPVSQARAAAACFRQGSLDLIPDCGHLPQIERPNASSPP
jgi:pimeloyl-ACP methyl ester carboxylesterase